MTSEDSWCDGSDPSHQVLEDAARSVKKKGMIMDLKEKLLEFSSMYGPSAFEADVARAALELMKPLTDETYIDKWGNAIGVLRCGRRNAKKFLFDAHIDEIGLMVTEIEDGGFLRFIPIGGVDSRILPDREVLILTDPPRADDVHDTKPIPGIVTTLKSSILDPDKAGKAFEIKDLRIDTGLSREKAEKLIPIGAPVVFRPGAFSLGKDLVCGKSFDDRACFITFVQTLEYLKGRRFDCDLYVCGTIREEVGLGGRTAAFSIHPDACVAVDVIHAVTVDSRGELFDTELGKGPVGGLGVGMSPWMTKRFFDLAETHRIPIQKIAYNGSSGTNGWEIRALHEGIPTYVFSLPLRYMHTPGEVISLKDMEYLSRLLAEFVVDPEWGGYTC